MLTQAKIIEIADFYIKSCFSGLHHQSLIRFNNQKADVFSYNVSNDATDNIRNKQITHLSNSNID